ncbi:fumarylacetoacetate hydrolase family protein [candidate division KSB1 bacterium]|nr:fumarylacetoacetate hydrolase family protein [candidate division KSB1 bacterium]
MVELDFFNKDDITEVIQTVKELRRLDDLRILSPIQFDVPISRPQKILCAGRNYLLHARESGNEAPTEPIFFAKMSSSMIPHQGRILLPDGVGRVDHEVELAVVISRQGHHIPEDRADEYIAGYTILNDVTARELQKKDMETKKPWLRSKSFDTFCPVGPYLVPSTVIPDVQNLEMILTVNGEIRQRSNTSQMIFPVRQLISYYSKFMTLEPGDIIATGTPEGISALHKGDIVRCQIEGIGTLENYVD